jgi:hypothetical protein
MAAVPGNGPSLVTASAVSEPSFSRESTMQEYLELKRFLLTRTQRFGGVLTLYILLVVSAEAASCCAIGACASYLYTAMLCRHIDRITPEDRIPMLEANQIRSSWARRIAKLQAGVRQQAQPRLLVRFLLYS